MNHNKFVRRQRLRRKARVRTQLMAGSSSRPRLAVFRSQKHMYVQLINDEDGRTLAAASTRDKELRGDLGKTANKDAAAAVGKAIAERAKAAGVTEVCFDRRGYKYHGRVAALADAAREAGLSF